MHSSLARAHLPGASVQECRLSEVRQLSTLSAANSSIRTISSPRNVRAVLANIEWRTRLPVVIAAAATERPEGEHRDHHGTVVTYGPYPEASADSASSTYPHATRRWSGLTRPPSPAAVPRRFGSSCPTRPEASRRHARGSVHQCPRAASGCSPRGPSDSPVSRVQEASGGRPRPAAPSLVVRRAYDLGAYSPSLYCLLSASLRMRRARSQAGSSPSGTGLVLNSHTPRP